MDDSSILWQPVGLSQLPAIPPACAELVQCVLRANPSNLQGDRLRRLDGPLLAS